MRLDDLLEQVTRVTAENNWPQGYLQSVRITLMQLYGDGPESFDGPDSFECGADWITFSFLEDDAIVGDLELTWFGENHMSVISHVMETRSYPGWENALEQLRLRFG